MGRKKVVRKQEKQTFHLLHRPYNDAVYAQDETPSEYVLVPANNGGGSQRERKLGKDFSIATALKQHKDHISPLGLVNDGYDYSQHFKDFGGGQFIRPDGTIQPAPKYPQPIALPPDMLPSGEEIERDFDAVTISDKYMDPDIRNALFDDADEEGEFEELDDDFIIQAMADVDEESRDFDFEAHMAKLMAASAVDAGYVPARNGANLVRNKEDSDEDEFSDYYESEGDEEDTEAVRPITSSEMEMIEAQFEKALEEYGDDEIGYLDDVDSDQVDGTIDIEGQDSLFNDILDEFLQKHDEGEHDKILANIEMVKRASADCKSCFDTDEDLRTPLDAETKSKLLSGEGLRQAVEDQEMKQLESEIELSDNVGIDDGRLAQDISSHPYLGQEIVREEWDCESILSTYSCLDNHPTLIQDKSTKTYKPHKSRYIMAEEAAAERRAKRTQDTGEKLMDNRNHSRLMMLEAPGKGGVTQITLKGKFSLPEVAKPPVTVKGTHKLKEQDKECTIFRVNTSSNSSSSRSGGDDNSDVKQVIQVLEAVQLDCNEDSDDDDDDDDMVSTTTGKSEAPKRDKNETAEQRKARKALVKDAKKIKRETKKQLKVAFKNEGVKQMHGATSRRQDTDHVSVFRYTD